ncbi:MULTISPECIES: hypothetical protein [Campylobacter]|uniref:hypothetical protein n=1 Tax=Campylobacter TaxID=194 RepID=UPI0023EF7D63|nr:MULTISPECIES: hypothetical protein [Campylobacter]MCI6641099.1 hypothetical protein [Campylobacter sp.]MDD7421860.1 hypothetical protein [Campylobacter hominis]MDY3117416.1 hypothetical protein [Campylobacter hominis]
MLDEKIPSAFSRHKNTAKNFALSSEYHILFKTTTIGKNEIDISEISHNTQESEILLKNGIMFEVLNIRKLIDKGGKKWMIIHLKSI